MNQNELSNLRFFFPQNESTKPIFQKRIHETNPRYESLRFGFTNPDSQIRILRIRKDSDSWISIFKDSFRAIVLRICRIRKNRWIFENWLDSWLTIRNESFKLRIRDPQYKTNPGFVITKQNQPFWSQDSWSRNETNPWIRKTIPCFYESLIRIPHPYKTYLNSMSFGLLAFWVERES